MNCHQIKELFSEYASGSMPQRLSTAVRDHFLECAECRQAYTRFTQTVKALDEMPDVQPPNNLHQLIMNRIYEEQETRSRSVWQQLKTAFQMQYRPLLTGFALLAVFALVNGFYPVKPAVTSLLQTDTQTVSKAAPSVMASKTTRVADGGLSLGYSASTPGIFEIALSSNANESTKYRVLYLTDGPGSSGVIEQGKSCVVQIAANYAQTTIARIDWMHKGISYSRNVFLPTKIDQSGSAKQIAFNARPASVMQTLNAIASEYGVAIVASGNLEGYAPGATLPHASADMAIYNTVAKAGFSWRQIGDSVYFLQPQT